MSVRTEHNPDNARRAVFSRITFNHVRRTDALPAHRWHSHAPTGMLRPADPLPAARGCGGSKPPPNCTRHAQPRALGPCPDLLLTCSRMAQRTGAGTHRVPFARGSGGGSPQHVALHRPTPSRRGGVADRKLDSGLSARLKAVRFFELLPVLSLPGIDLGAASPLHLLAYC